MLRTLKRATEWIFWTFVAALLQMWIDLATHAYHRGHIDWFEELKQGVLLFVIAATMSGIAVDFWLDEKKSKDPNALRRVAFLGVPGFALIFVVWAYGLAQTDLSDVEQRLFVEMNAVALFMCAIYSIVAKTYLYWQEGETP